MTTDQTLPALRILALCPALALSDTVVNALGIGVIALLAITVSSLLATAATRTLADEIRAVSCVLILAAVVGCLALLLNAHAHELYRSLGIFLPLLIANYVIQRCVEKSSTAAPVQAVITAIKTGSRIALTLIALGIARELVGRGSLLHDAALMFGDWAQRFDLQLFRADMGFLLATLPPGAFISLGLLLAARNWWMQRISRT